MTGDLKTWRGGKSAPATLADLARGIDTATIACSKCDRGDRYPLAASLARYGPRFAVADWLRLLSMGCPMRESVDPYARCGIHVAEFSSKIS